MPRGLSWQQEFVLVDLAVQKELGGEYNDAIPVVRLTWGDYSLSYDRMEDRALAAKRIDANLRRGLDGLERRGLIELCWRPFLVNRDDVNETRYLRLPSGVELGHSKRLLRAASITEAGEERVKSEHPTNSMLEHLEMLVRQARPKVLGTKQRA